MLSYPEEKARFKRHQGEYAISLALQSRWAEALAANKAILEIFPTDVDAWNRLGKALAELGRHDEARDAYKRALEIDSGNTIARKNLERLSGLKGATRHPVAPNSTRLDPRLFIEERGKTVVTSLQNVAPKDVLARVPAGDQVVLRSQGRSIRVETNRGELIGQIEPRLALRLLKLMEGGNRYVAAITSLTDNVAKVIIREVYQAPALAGRVSFPAKASTGFRPYIKDSLLQHGIEEEEDYVEEEEDEAEWEEETALPHREDTALYEEPLSALEQDTDDELEEE